MAKIAKLDPPFKKGFVKLILSGLELRMLQFGYDEHINRLIPEANTEAKKLQAQLNAFKNT
jgi:hypothetical protein